MRRLALALLVAACGGAAPTLATSPADPDPVRLEAASPFPRLTALPAAPRIVADVDLAQLRGGAIYAMLEAAMDGGSAEDRAARRILERAERVVLGLYSEDRSIVLIARGPLEGIAADIGQERGVSRIDRLGMTAYVVSDEMVVVETATDTVVITHPRHLDEILRAAAGEAPAVPLPAELRALGARGAFEGASLAMRFLARPGLEPSDALAALVREAGAAGAAGRLEGSDIVATASARVPLESRARELAADLERMARGVTESEVESAGLAEGIRNAVVRVDDRWVEIELRFPATEIERFVSILGALGGS